MYVIGLSFGFHDSSVSLLKNGRLIFHVTEQEFTKQKHDESYPVNAINYLRRKYNINSSNIDYIAYNENPTKKFVRVLSSSLSRWPFSSVEFTQSMKSWFGNKIWYLNRLRKDFDINYDKIKFLDHHTSHAAQAFMGSGFKDSDVIVCDAVGDWSSTTLYRGSWNKDGPVIEKVLDHNFPNSLGLLYSVFTSFLGFKPNSQECNLMALAPYGEPIYKELIKKHIFDYDKPQKQMNIKYVDINRFFHSPITKDFIKIFGAPRKKSHDFNLKSYSDKKPLFTEDTQRYCDIASSVQAFFEDAISSLLQNFSLNRSENLCFSGGTALNCVANSKLFSCYENVFIPYDPGDGGAATGAAQFCHARIEKSTLSDVYKYKTPYLGPEVDDDNVQKIIDGLDISELTKYLPYYKFSETEFTLENLRYEDDLELIPELVYELMAGKILGVFRGRSEAGPRALGNRSIIFRPDRVDLLDKMNQSVKKRPSFRPYALSMTDIAAEKILNTSIDIKQLRWMQYVLPVKKDFLDKVVCGLHTDKTTRPHICLKEDNFFYNSLLTAFGKEYGLSCFLNTSFNESGQPMTSSSYDALATFLRTPIDILLVGNTLVTKRYR